MLSLSERPATRSEPVEANNASVSPTVPSLFTWSHPSCHLVLRLSARSGRFKHSPRTRCPFTIGGARSAQRSAHPLKSPALDGGGRYPYVDKELEVGASNA